MSRRNGLVLAAVLLLSGIAPAQTRGASGLRIQSQPLPNGSINKTYSAAIQLTGGTAPVQWKLTNGKLPPGITLQPTSGILSGTPTAPGEYRFTISVTDGTDSASLPAFTIQVNAAANRPPTISGTPGVSVNVG